MVDRISEIDWQQWQPELVTSLMFVKSAGEVLLIKKKTGIGAGKINGPGGKIEALETPLECAVRETSEELGIEVIDPEPMAELFFHAIEMPRIKAFVYVSEHFTGIPRETREARPIWYPLQQLPLDAMWEDDRYWLPQILAGQPLTGWFSFKGEHLIDHTIETGPVSF